MGGFAEACRRRRMKINVVKNKMMILNGDRVSVCKYLFFHVCVCDCVCA